jgi:hypothetical protein
MGSTLLENSNLHSEHAVSRNYLWRERASEKIINFKSGAFDPKADAKCMLPDTVSEDRSVDWNVVGNHAGNVLLSTRTCVESCVESCVPYS